MDLKDATAAGPNLKTEDGEEVPPLPPRRTETAATSTSESESPKPPPKGIGNSLHHLSKNIAAPLNDFANFLGSEAIWPTEMGKECEKAARILRTFCIDAVYNGPVEAETGPSPDMEQMSLVKIPASVISSAAGLAVFTVFRSGMNLSWSSGSGVVVARLPDGSWSPPSAFSVNTLSAGFMFAFDIYDCVCVLRTPEAVDAFVSGTRFSLGGEVAVTAGPVGTSAYVESVIRDDEFNEPIWSYTKSRGVYVGAQVDGTLIYKRKHENAEFYDREILVEDILKGKVPEKAGMWPQGAKPLMETLKAIDEAKDKDPQQIEEEKQRQVSVSGEKEKQEGNGKPEESEKQQKDEPLISI